MVNHAAHRGNETRTDAGRHGQPDERNVVLGEKVDAAPTALKNAEVPVAVLPEAPRRLDHRSTAVRTGGGFGHGSK